MLIVYKFFLQSVLIRAFRIWGQAVETRISKLQMYKISPQDYNRMFKNNAI
jgi:hypothetical protein